MEHEGPYPITGDEVERFIFGTKLSALRIREALTFIPPDLRAQWIELAVTDGAAATKMAMDRGWRPIGIF
jgi:hypothetical protein